MMCSKGTRRPSTPILALFLLGQSVFAAEVGVEFEFGIGQTNNITRTPDTEQNPAIEDTVYTAALDLNLNHASARAELDLRGSLMWLDYRDDPYESETLPALDATAIVRITDEVLSWFAYGNVGQQTVDPFSPVTPDNRQDVSYLTTGPSITVPLGSRNSLRVDAWTSDVRYESQPLDNTRRGAQLGLARQINPTRSLSLNVRGEETEFDEDTLFPEIDRLDAFLQFDTEGSRNRLRISLGASRIERQGSEADEPLATLEWERQVSPRTALILTGGTRVSDSADSFRDTQSDGVEIGDVQNQQSVTSPFRQDFLGLTLNYTLARLSVSAAGRWGTEEYQDDLLGGLDRDARSLALNVSRRLGNSWTGVLFGNIDRFDYDSILRVDKDRSAGISLVWSRPRTLEIELRADRFDRDSTDSGTEFQENRIFLGFRYIPEIG